jgi:hypothetical protein
MTTCANFSDRSVNEVYWHGDVAVDIHIQRQSPFSTSTNSLQINYYHFSQEISKLTLCARLWQHDSAEQPTVLRNSSVQVGRWSANCSQEHNTKSTD